MNKPFKSENDEINKLINWIIENFEAKNDLKKVVPRTMSNIGTIADRDADENEIMIRENGGIKQLVVRYKNNLIQTIDFS